MHLHYNHPLGRLTEVKRTSWAVDVLGRELEVQYNEDKRVIASRDFGGERYGIDLDERAIRLRSACPTGIV